MIPRRRRRAVRSLRAKLRATKPPREALVVAIMPARARMHVVAPRFKKWCIAGKGKTLKRVRPMRKISVVFAACLFAGSAIALEAAQDTPNQAQSTEPTPEAAAPSPKPAAEAPAPSPKPAAEAPAPSSKPTAEAPAPRRAAKGAKPEVAPEHKTENNVAHRLFAGLDCGDQKAHQRNFQSGRGFGHSCFHHRRVGAGRLP